MGDIRLRTVMTADLGNEQVRSASDHIIVGGAVREHKVATTIRDDDADGNVTLYDETTAAVNNAAGTAPFRLIEFLVDPKSKKATVLEIDLELRMASGDLFVFLVTRSCPFRLNRDVVYPTLGGAVSRIDRIRAKNRNAAPSGGGDNDVEVLLRMLRT